MAARTSGLLGEVGAVLNGLPGVFSTVQWGGRAYKVPGPGTGSKAKLLAFVSCDDDGQGVYVSFKLKPKRAHEVVDRHDWVEPHSFRTLAPSGWVSARLRTKRQLAALAPLLQESRELYAPVGATETNPSRQRQSASASAPAPGADAAKRIEHVMNNLRAAGWSPPQD
jgi:predicted DNA-binding protein (MmcQ/YjbR family)